MEVLFGYERVFTVRVHVTGIVNPLSQTSVIMR
jgi:hypothetical protein